MLAAIVRPFLLFVGFVAGLKVVVALVSALYAARAAPATLFVSLGVFLCLAATVAWLRAAPRCRNTAMLVVLVVSFATAVVGMLRLALFVADRAGYSPMFDVRGTAELLQECTGLGLCAIGLLWGAVCAARVLQPCPNTSPTR